MEPEKDVIQYELADNGICTIWLNRPHKRNCVSPQLLRELEVAVDRAAAEKKALAVDIHALSEKPLCPTYAEARALVDEVGGAIRVMVNENWRYRAYFRQIAEWLQAGKLGTVTLARLALWRSSMLPRAEDGRAHLAPNDSYGRF